MLSLKSLFQRQPEPLIGLDISATAVKLVELARHGQDGWTLERCTMVPLPPGCIVDGSIANMDEVSATIHRLLAKSGTRTKNVALALPASAVITKKVILPGALSDQEMEIQVESEASQYLPFALEEVRLDFCVIGPNAKNPGDVDVLLAATRKEKAHERQDAAEIAGLKPTVLDIESYAALLAVQRVLDHPQAPAHVGEADLAVLINVGDRGYTMQVLRGEEILFDHEQGMGGAQLTQAIAATTASPPKRPNKKSATTICRTITPPPYWHPLSKTWPWTSAARCNFSLPAPPTTACSTSCYLVAPRFWKGWPRPFKMKPRFQPWYSTPSLAWRWVRRLINQKYAKRPPPT